jgi:hypothetical protein
VGTLQLEEAAAAAVQLGTTVWAPARMDYSTARLCMRYMGDASLLLPATQLARHLAFVRHDDKVSRGPAHSLEGAG